MDQISSVSSLKKRLQQKTQQDQQENRQLILNEQEKLLSDLQHTYKSALDTTLNDIRESLKTRLSDMAMLTAQEAQTVEKMVEQHQEKLTKTLSSHYSKATKAIRAQVDPATESLNRLTVSLEKANEAAEKASRASRRRWIVGWSIGLIVLMIICGASWGLLQYLSEQVQRNLTTIQAQKEMIQYLEEQTHGLEVTRTGEGLFLVLPQGAETGYKIGERLLVKLPIN